MFKKGDYVKSKDFNFGVITQYEDFTANVSWIGGSGYYEYFELEKVEPTDEDDNSEYILMFKDYEITEIREYILGLCLRFGRKDYLRQSDVVKLRNGKPYTYYNGDFFNLEKENYVLGDFNDDLTHKIDSELDIVGIYNQYGSNYEMEDLYDDRGLIELWKRIEKSNT